MKFHLHLVKVKLATKFKTGRCREISILNKETILIYSDFAKYDKDSKYTFLWKRSINI